MPLTPTDVVWDDRKTAFFDEADKVLHLRFHMRHCLARQLLRFRQLCRRISKQKEKDDIDKQCNIEMDIKEHYWRLRNPDLFDHWKGNIITHDKHLPGLGKRKRLYRQTQSSCDAGFVNNNGVYIVKRV